LFPGICAELIRSGAISADPQRDVVF
jgi:hypothetical protein